MTQQNIVGKQHWQSKNIQSFRYDGDYYDKYVYKVSVRFAHPSIRKRIQPSLDELYNYCKTHMPHGDYRHRQSWGVLSIYTSDFEFMDRITTEFRDWVNAVYYANAQFLSQKQTLAASVAQKIKFVTKDVTGMPYQVMIGGSLYGSKGRREIWEAAATFIETNHPTSFRGSQDWHYFADAKRGHTKLVLVYKLRNDMYIYDVLLDVADEASIMALYMICPDIIKRVYKKVKREHA